MKAIKFISYLTVLAPIASAAIFFILLMNVAGWIDGCPGGLTGTEFIRMVWTMVILLGFSIVWYSLIGLIVKKSPIKCYQVIAHKLGEKFYNFMQEGQDEVE